MTPIGLLGLAGTVASAVAGQPDSMLSPAIYVSVYTCFAVLGLSFALTAWRTRQAAPASAPRPLRSARPAPFLAHPQEDR